MQQMHSNSNVRCSGGVAMQAGVHPCHWIVSSFALLIFQLYPEHLKLLLECILLFGKCVMEFGMLPVLLLFNNKKEHWKVFVVYA
jgi:hypothetical protein